MTVIEKKVMNVLSRTVEKAKKSTVSESGWPPTCMGILYQPKRPSVMKDTEERRDKK